MFTGAKGGSSSFQQTPDNLRSNDTFEGVLGLCIGPIKGPRRGLKSIKLDTTAIENDTGELNYQDFVATIGDGDPLKFPQPVQLKLGAGASPLQVGLTLTNLNGANAVWATRTLANTNASFIDLRFVVQQLFRQDSKGVYNLAATLNIQMKPVGSTTWITPTLGTPNTTYSETGFDDDAGNRTYLPRAYFNQSGGYIPQNAGYVINGKTSSPAVYELRLSVPNTGPYADTGWDVRVQLAERDSYDDGNGSIEKRTIQWESMAAVYPDTLGTDEGWRGVSWVQFYGKASDQLTGVPEVTGEYDTKIVSVPAGVYDPDTRQYTGAIWDGSWAKAFTNDPAWVINDAISDELAGVSLIAVGSYLNKWDALELSKWCSQLVPDGNGGYQPRYSLNLSISTPQKAEDFIRYLAGAVGALAWDQGDGEWRCKVDKPDAPVDIFTLDNIEGEFVYGNTDVDTRFNNIIGQFKNADLDYQADSVELFDNDSIALIGRKPTTIALVGCTNRQEALRRVKLRIRSTVNENRIVTFTTNRRGRNIEQLSTILIADGDLGDQAQRTTGRIVAISDDRKTITVRDPMYLAPGVAYQIQFAMPNAVYSPETATQPTSTDWTKPTVVITRNVVGTSGAVRTLTLDQAVPNDVADNLSIALTAPGLITMPRLFRVTNVAPADDGERISISAINIDIGKWDASDNVSKQDTVFQDLRGAAPVPTLIDGQPLLSLIAVPIAQGKQINLQANWVRPASAFLSGFRIQYSINGGALQTAVERQQTATWELPNAGPGLYHVEICSMDRRGGYSLPLTGDLEVTQALIDATQIYYQGSGGLPLASLQALKPAQPGADVTGQNTAQDTKNVAGTPAAQLVAAVAATSPLLDTTPPPVPTGLALTSTVKTDTDGSQIVTLAATWNAITAPKNPLANYVLALKEANGGYVEFTIGSTSTRFERVVGANTLFTAKVRAVDANNNTSGFSSEVAYTTTKDTVPPAVPTGLNATTSVTSAFLSWTNPTDSDLATIEIWESQTNNSATATKIATVNGRPGQTGGFTRSALMANTAYYYWLKAVDSSGNASGFGTGTTVTIRSITNADLTQGLVVPQAVPTLPAAAGYTGPVLVFNQADGKLYRYTGGAFVASTATTDLTGTISDSQVTALSSSKLLGQLTDSQLAALSTTKLVGTITNGQIGAGAVSADKFATGLQPLRTLSSLSDAGTEGNVGIYQGKVYRYTGGAWTTSVASSDISGTISDAQVAGLSASKVTGQLSDTQLAAISAAKLIGSVTDSQLSGISAGKITGSIVDGQISALSASKVSGQLTDGQLASGAKIATVAPYAGAVVDTRNDNQPPSFYYALGLTVRTEFKYLSVLGLTGGTWGALETIVQWQDASGGPVKQTCRTDAGGVYERTSTSTTAWGSWTANYNAANKPTLGSDVLTSTGAMVTDTTALNANQQWSQVNSRPANVAALTGSEAIQNTGIIISSGYIYGIGTGNATPVSNNLISIDGSGALQGITGGGVAVVNSNISVQNNTIYGIGTGNGTAVANAGISVNADGSLTGAGGGRPSLPSMAGVLTDAQIAALSAAKLTGQITTTQITDGGITTAKLSAGAVTTANLAAGAVTASTIATGAITISSAGALSTGGQVTIAGLGYTGDLNATRNTADRYLNRNSSFSDWTTPTTPTGWTTFAYGRTGTMTQTTSNVGRGGFAAALANETARYGDPIPVSAGETLWVEYRFMTTAAGSQAGGPNWYIGGDGVYNDLVTPYAPYYMVASNAQFPVGSVQTGVMQFTIGSNGFFRPLIVFINSPGATGIVDYLAFSREQPGSTVGAPVGTLVGGTAAATVESRANDPAAWINAGSTTTINGGRITTGSITAGQLAANTITAGQIAAGAITTAALAAGAVTANQVAAGTITGDRLAANTITATQIASRTITAANIVSGTITSGEIAASTITASNIAAGTITASQIAAGTIQASNIAAGTITGDRIAGNTIQGASMVAGTITGDKISAGTITAALIAAGTITASNIAASTITGDRIAGNTIQGASLVAGTITGDRIAAGTITGSLISTSTSLPGTISIGSTGVTIGTLQTSVNDGLVYADTRNDNQPPSYYYAKYAAGSRTVAEFKSSGAIGVGSGYCQMVTTIQWGDGSGGPVQQEVRDSNGHYWNRISTSTSAWGPWTDTGYQVNTGSTLINSGMILVSGATKLSDWRNGGDKTKIEGGSIAANTVAANKLTIGNRGISVIGCDFSYQNGVLNWSDGYVLWTDDSGNPAATYINGGSASWGGGSFNYIYWTKGSSTLTSGVDNWQTAQNNSANSIIFVTWRNGSNFVANYGGTIITGDRIVTGSVTAAQIAAGTITGDRIAGGTITASQIAAGSITADRINGNGSLPASLVIGSTGFSLGSTAAYTGIDSANRIPYSQFEAGSNGGAWVTPAYNPGGYGSDGSAFLYNGKVICRVGGNFTNSFAADSNQQYSIEQTNRGMQFWSPVQPGERVFVSALLESVNASIAFYVVFSRSDGSNQQGYQINGADIRVGGFPGGVDQSWAGNRFGGFFTVPPDCTKAALRFYAHALGSGNSFMSVAEPMLCSAGPTQTAWPNFSPGPVNVDPAQLINSGVYSNTTITGGKITTGTLDANRVLVDSSLGNGKIQVNAVTSFIAVANSNSYQGSGTGNTTPTGGGSGGGGGGGGYGCVAIESYTPHEVRAGDLEVGGPLTVLADDMETIHDSTVEAIKIIEQPCYRVKTVSGITLIASTSTPITCRDGSVISIMHAATVDVPVLDHGDLRWEGIARMDYLGIRKVALITTFDGTYAAGETPDRYILTHNKQQYPQN